MAKYISQGSLHIRQFQTWEQISTLLKVMDRGDKKYTVHRLMRLNGAWKILYQVTT